jgi:transposase
MNIPLGHDLLEIAQAHRISKIPTNAQDDDLGFKMAPLKQRWPVPSHERPKPIRLVPPLRKTSVPGVGAITALTWALEIGDVSRFPLGEAGHQLLRIVLRREELSRQGVTNTSFQTRNKHIQRVLVEAAKLAPKTAPELALEYEKAKLKGNANRATIAVARKMATNGIANSPLAWSDP